MIGLVPAEGVAEFILQFRHLLGAPTIGVIICVIFWYIDVMWTALFKHGLQLVIPLAIISMMVATYLLYQYFKMKSFVRGKLELVLNSTETSV
mmetsp:Transcript_103724/g.260120  ORF Transcript_103724/g.260120 Transcript_103724/m.260120 type:complete len:93 (-) Transcript_103724:201-479(-)